MKVLKDIIKKFLIGLFILAAVLVTIGLVCTLIFVLVCSVALKTTFIVLIIILGLGAAYLIGDACYEYKRH